MYILHVYVCIYFSALNYTSFVTLPVFHLYLYIGSSVIPAISPFQHHLVSVFLLDAKESWLSFITNPIIYLLTNQFNQCTFTVIMTSLVCRSHPLVSPLCFHFTRLFHGLFFTELLPAGLIIFIPVFFPSPLLKIVDCIAMILVIHSSIFRFKLN